jgi:hypothetical protein
MTGVRREDQRPIVYFLRYVEALGREIGSDAGNHRRTVEVKTTVVRPKFLSYDLRETGQMFRRGSLVDHALMPGRIHGCSVGRAADEPQLCRRRPRGRR